MARDTGYQLHRNDHTATLVTKRPDAIERTTLLRSDDVLFVPHGVTMPQDAVDWIEEHTAFRVVNDYPDAVVSDS